MRLSPDETAVQDQDGDGLLDCEEVAEGTDVNCDDALVPGEDVIFSELHGVPADPAIPDIYVEVDWADCNETATLDGDNYGLCEVINARTMAEDRRSFEPPQEVFDLIEDEFSDNGYQLHFKKSGAFPATMGVPARRESGEDLAFSVLPSLVGSTTDEALYAV